MAVSIGSLLFDIRASSVKLLSQDVPTSLKAAEKFGKQMSLAVAAGAVATAGAITAIYVKTANEIDKIAKKADALGVSLKGLRVLNDIGDLAGVASDKISSSLDTMRKNIFLAETGNKKAEYSFKALGLSISDLLKLSPDQQFQKIAEAILKVENTTVQAGYATKIFGDEGLRMVNLLKGGNGVIDETARKLEGLGIVLDRVDAAKIEVANDAITDLRLVVRGAAEQFTVALAPIIAKAAKDMLTASKETHGFKDAIKSLVDVTVQGVGIIGNVFRGWHLVVKLGTWAFSELIAAAGNGTQLLIRFVERAVLGSIQMLNVFLAYIKGSMLNLASGMKLLGAGMQTGIVPGAKLAGEAVSELAKKVDEFVKKSDPSVSTEALKKTFDSIKGVYEAGTEVWSGVAQESWNELRELAEKPLPSQALTQWVEDARTQTQEAAEDIAANVQAVYEAVDVPDIKEEKLARIVKTMQVRVFNPIQDALDSFQNSIGGLVRGTMTWNDALFEVAATFATTVLQALVQVFAAWIAQKIAFELIGAQMLGTVTAATVASAGLVQAAWVPAALAANIATLGAAAGVGMSSFISTMALGSLAGIGIGAGASFIGGFLNTAASGAGGVAGSRASGGPVSAGSLYRVNEFGTEYFRPNFGGTVIPLGGGREAMSESGQALTVNVTQNFHSGVTRADLAIESEKIKRRTIEAVAEAVNRGGSYRKRIQE